MMMRMPKFMLLVCSITFISCLYVRQQTDVYSSAYAEQKKQASFEDLLDKNSLLRYNLKKNTSLICMGSKVSESEEFRMPNNYLLVKVSDDSNNRLNLASQAIYRNDNFVSRLFGVKRQAEAKTLNPE